MARNPSADHAIIVEQMARNLREQDPGNELQNTAHPDPCPVCSGQRREADGTFTIRQPLWEYVVEVLRAWVHDAEPSVIGCGDLLRLALEIEQEMKR